MKTFETFINENLTVKSLSWKKEIDGWSIEVNDRVSHSMLTRLQDRTSIPLKAIRDKIYKGISYTINKANKGFFKEILVTVGLEYKLSNFKLVLTVFPNEKKITIVTILDKDMKFSHLIKWELNEFKRDIFDVECELNECKIQEGFLFEPSLDKKTIDVFYMYTIVEMLIEE